MISVSRASMRSVFRFPAIVLLASLAIAQWKAAASEGMLPPVDFSKGPLKVSDNGRYLVHENGAPFFYLGDTAWELFHRLDREEAVRYLEDRARKGFTVIQAVALAELDGLNDPNPYGHTPLVENDPARPDVKDGPGNDYWDHVDFIIDKARDLGMYIGLLPTWGVHVTKDWRDGTERMDARGVVNGIFDAENAEVYGRFIGGRYKDRTNIIWILGGDRAASTEESKNVWRAMAKGIAIGVSGGEDYGRVLMTYHPVGARHSTEYFPDEEWIDFNSIQSGHGVHVLNYEKVAMDYAREPVKPVIDLETSYPGVAFREDMVRAGDNEARRTAWWAVLSGAFGHTYGHNGIWQMFAPGRKPAAGARTYWFEAIHAPSAAQMGVMRALMESRPMLERVPDPSLIQFGQREGLGHIAAARGEDHAFVYFPSYSPTVIDLGKIGAERISAWWLDPRTGASTPIGEFGAVKMRFDPPGGDGPGDDWVLVLEDATKNRPMLSNLVSETTQPVELPFGRHNPVIYDNDDHRDVYTDEYLLALAHAGSIDLRGMITSYSANAGEYELFVKGRREIVEKARRSGFQNLPAVIAGASQALTRPENDRFLDTAPQGPGAARFIVEEAHKATPEKPLVVIAGGQLTSVASAWLLSPTIAQRVVVAGVFGADERDYNAGLDPWAWTIVLTQFRVVSIPIGPPGNRGTVYMKPPEVSKARIEAELPQDIELFRWMFEKKHPSNALPDGHDYDGQPAVLPVQPRYLTKAERYRTVSLAENGNPVLLPAKGGPIVKALDADQALATEEFWRALTTAAELLDK